MKIGQRGMTRSPVLNTKTYRMRRSIPLFLTCCLSVAASATASYSAAENMPSAQARPMTAVELYFLYRDKTWTWADGAGRFDDEGRRFTAMARTGKKTTWAQGRWTVTDDGRLCLNADWHTASGVNFNKTCFSHKSDNGTIYQRKEPSGSWYVFKHALPAQGDEFLKLVSENLVSPDLATTKSDLENQKRVAGNVTTDVASRRKTNEQ